MKVLATTSWLQKHPTPSSASWEFHWHSLDGDRTAELVSRLAGGRHQHPFSAALVQGRELWWLRSFEGEAPAEQRRYTGLVVERLEASGDLSTRELLLRASQTPAAPWTASAGSLEPRVVELTTTSSVSLATARLAARLAAAGNELRADVVDDSLPHALAQLLPWMPELEQRLREGVRVAGHAASARSSARTLAHYLELVAFGSAPLADRQRAWDLATDYARAAGRERDEAFADLAALAAAWTDSRTLWSYLIGRHISDADVARSERVAPAPLWHEGVEDAGWLWNRVVNYWGRGFLAEGAAQRVARVLLGRIAVDHLYRLEHSDAAHPWRYLARLRWEALLPGSRTRAMLERLAHCSPTIARVATR